jgi:hypothetical protein
VEVIGVVIIGLYTVEAHRQNCSLCASIRQQAMIYRPLLLPYPISSNAEGADARVMNFGKTVALEVVVPGEVVSIGADEAPPFDSRCQKDEPPKGLYMTPLAPDAPYMAAEPWKLRPEKSGDTIYAVGCIYYKDLAKVPHYTDICTQLIGGQFIDCKRPGRNYVK